MQPRFRSSLAPAFAVVALLACALLGWLGQSRLRDRQLADRIASSRAFTGRTSISRPGPLGESDFSEEEFTFELAVIDELRQDKARGAAVVRLLLESDVDERRYAGWSLIQEGVASDLVTRPVVVRLVNDPSEVVRAWGCYVLCRQLQQLRRLSTSDVRWLYEWFAADVETSAEVSEALASWEAAEILYGHLEGAVATPAREDLQRSHTRSLLALLLRLPAAQRPAYLSKAGGSAPLDSLWFPMLGSQDPTLVAVSRESLVPILIRLGVLAPSEYLEAQSSPTRVQQLLLSRFGRFCDVARSRGEEVPQQVRDDVQGLLLLRSSELDPNSAER